MDINWEDIVYFFFGGVCEIDGHFVRFTDVVDCCQVNIEEKTGGEEEHLPSTPISSGSQTLASDS